MRKNYVYMRPVAGVDAKIFENVATNFVDKTSLLRRRGKKYYLSSTAMLVMFYISHCICFKKTTSSLLVYLRTNRMH